MLTTINKRSFENPDISRSNKRARTTSHGISSLETKVEEVSLPLFGPGNFVIPDVVPFILGYLSPGEFMRMGLVSKAFYDLTKNNSNEIGICTKTIIASNGYPLYCLKLFLESGKLIHLEQYLACIERGNLSESVNLQEIFQQNLSKVLAKIEEVQDLKALDFIYRNSNWFIRMNERWKFAHDLKFSFENILSSYDFCSQLERIGELIGTNCFSLYFGLLSWAFDKLPTEIDNLTSADQFKSLINLMHQPHIFEIIKKSPRKLDILIYFQYRAGRVISTEKITEFIHNKSEDIKENLGNRPLFNLLTHLIFFFKTDLTNQPQEKLSVRSSVVTQSLQQIYNAKEPFTSDEMSEQGPFCPTTKPVSHALKSVILDAKEFENLHITLNAVPILKTVVKCLLVSDFVELLIIARDFGSPNAFDALLDARFYTEENRKMKALYATILSFGQYAESEFNNLLNAHDIFQVLGMIGSIGQPSQLMKFIKALPRKFDRKLYNVAKKILLDLKPLKRDEVAADMMRAARYIGIRRALVKDCFYPAGVSLNTLFRIANEHLTDKDYQELLQTLVKGYRIFNETRLSELVQHFDPYLKDDDRENVYTNFVETFKKKVSNRNEKQTKKIRSSIVNVIFPRLSKSKQRCYRLEFCALQVIPTSQLLDFRI